MPDKDLAEIFRNVVWLSTKLREGRITLYNVVPSEGLGRAFYYTQFLKGVDSASKVQGANLGLQVLAVQSGGEVLNRSNDIGDSMASCLEDAKVYYTLSFDSPVAGHADEYHSLQVKIDKPRLTARTRTGYYAQP
jgi:VWFA-related protein